MLAGLWQAAGAARLRVVVSSDIGGTDPDDFQSMVHFLVYADMFDVEGLISSPYGPGRREHILQVIDLYAQDYPNLKTHSAGYPPPDALRAISRQGAIEGAGFAGLRRADRGLALDRPSARDARTRGRCTFWSGAGSTTSPRPCTTPPISCPSSASTSSADRTRCGASNAYNYIEENHPKLWIIEANATYRGWFVGRRPGGRVGQFRDLSRRTLPAMARSGDFFATLLNGTIKMGDTPSVGPPAARQSRRPVAAGLGRQIRAHLGRTEDRLHASDDRGGSCGGLRRSRVRPAAARRHDARQYGEMIFDGRIPVEGVNDGDVLRFRFSPRDAKVWPYRIESDFAGLDGQSGRFTAVPPPAARTGSPLRRASELVDRRSRSRGRRGRASRREEREPMAAGFPERFRGAHAALQVARRAVAIGGFMKRFAVLVLLTLACFAVLAAQKPRVIVLTDIENEPDDSESMVRFLTYSNQLRCGGAGRDHLHPSEGQDRGGSHPPDRGSLRQGQGQPGETRTRLSRRPPLALRDQGRPARTTAWQRWARARTRRARRRSYRPWTATIRARSG